MPAVSNAAASESSASRRRRRRGAGLALVTCLAVGAAAAAASDLPWRSAAQQSAGLVGVSRGEAASFAGAVEKRADEILPGLAGALRQAFLALVEKQCDIVFDEVDHDSSGRLNSAELHVAILLAYGRLNQILGSMALDAPHTQEVKELLAASADARGELTREGFREIFVQKFLHKVAAQAGARLLTQKLLVPAGGVALNFLAQEWQLSRSLESLLSGRSVGGPRGVLVHSIKQTVTSRILSQLGKALGPLVNLRLAAAAAQASHVEDLIRRCLAERTASEEPGKK
mmetsp:Transcript_5013/g.16140  ORF Transcript_5013/g.16140 Transcript_5013/m.16140 type:complete len:286 (-) Transcript_5013:57-914(-)